MSVVVSWFILLPHSSAWASDVFGSAAVQLAVSVPTFYCVRTDHLHQGIYPTIVIILAAHQRTIKDAAGLNAKHASGHASSSSLGIETHMSFVPAPTTTTAAATSSPTSTGLVIGVDQPRTSFIQLRLNDISDNNSQKATHSGTSVSSEIIMKNSAV